MLSVVSASTVFRNLRKKKFWHIEKNKEACFFKQETDIDVSERHFWSNIQIGRPHSSFGAGWIIGDSKTHFYLGNILHNYCSVNCHCHLCRNFSGHSPIAPKSNRRSQKVNGSTFMLRQFDGWPTFSHVRLHLARSCYSSSWFSSVSEKLLPLDQQLVKKIVSC